MFDTYGPFTMPSHDDAGIEFLFDEQIKKDLTSGIHEGVGVYIVAAKGPNGELIPWYVGRTHKEFGGRMIQHYKRGRFQELSHKGALEFFFLARASNGRVLKRDEAMRGNSAKAINHLELLLIGTCLKLNPELLNKQEKGFYQNFHVAGFIDGGPVERDFSAAKALSKLLKT